MATTSYAYGIQLLPPLIVGPLFMRERVEFGVVTQSAMAFSTLLGAFSLIVTQIQQLSSYASVLARLGILTGAIERTGAVTSRPASTGAGHIAFEELTLHSRSGELLLTRLTLAVTTGTRLLVHRDGRGTPRAISSHGARSRRVRGAHRRVRPGRDRISARAAPRSARDFA